MTYCCRICAKKYTCQNFDKKENCPDCISYVLLAMRDIDKKLKEDTSDTIRTFKTN